MSNPLYMNCALLGMPWVWCHIQSDLRLLRLYLVFRFGLKALKHGSYSDIHSSVFPAAEHDQLSGT